MTTITPRWPGLVLLVLAFIVGAAHADTRTVSTPGELQAALTEFQSNGQNDTISLDPCSGDGCVGGVYQITTPLTYTAPTSEAFSITIDGFDSDTRILDGGNVSAILRIDAPNATQINVRNMTLRNGNAGGTGSDADADGGALWISGNTGSIEILGSVYENNQASDDGGAVFIRTDPSAEVIISIDDITFQGNSALGTAGDGTGDGGAVHIATNPAVSIDVDNTDFIGNQADGNGGGLEIEGLDPSSEVPVPAGPVNLFDVGFEDNTAGGAGGGASFSSGSIIIDRSGFVGNEGSRGGGLHVRRQAFEATIANTGFAGNVASENGGGFALDRREGADIIIIHNTIYANTASSQGGGFWVDLFGSTGRARIYNNIVYNNLAETATDVFIENDWRNDIPAEVVFSHNAITSLDGFPDASTAFVITNASSLSQAGNIDDEPVLPEINDPDDPLPTQGPTSPTIDAGLNDPIANNFPPVDYKGTPRPQDGDGDGTATNDIGMDEFSGEVQLQADLVVSKTASASTIEGGMDLTYSITVDNDGPDLASGVTVTDTLDAGVTLVSANFDQGTACTAGGNPVVVTCALGSIAANDDSNGTIVVTTPIVEVEDTIENTVTVTANEPDPQASNNTAVVSTIVVPAGPDMANLALASAAQPNPVFSGGPELSFTLTVDNNGPDTATSVVITDTVPDGTTFVSATASAGTGCTGPDGTGNLSCALGDLASGSNATVTFVVLPDVVTEPTDIANNAAVSSATEDPDLGDNAASTTVTVNAPASDMRVTITATPGDPFVGDTVTYTVQITNDGPSDDTGVFVEITLPAEVTVQSVAPSTGECDLETDPVVCQFGDLADGDTVTITVVVIAPSEAGSIVFEATVGGDITDPTSTNNSASSQLDIIDAIEIIVRGTGGSGSVGPFGLSLLLAAAVAVWFWRSRGTAPGRNVSLLLLVVISVGLAAPVVKAQSLDDWYVGASIGPADAGYSSDALLADLAARGWTISNVSTDDSDTAWKLYTGYEFTDRLSFEVGYANLGEVVTQYSTSVPPNQIDALLRDTVAVHPYLGEGWFAAGVLRWPFVPNQWSVTARAGLFAWEADIDVDVIQGATGSATDKDTGTDGMFGLGIEWHANPQWSVTLEWERYKLNEWVDVPTVGVRWRF